MRPPLFLLALPALFAAPALTAANAVPQGAGGAGSGPISGYTVSAISYELDDENVAAVSFRLTPAGATAVKARLAPDEPWTTCTIGADVASCPVAAPLAAARSLDVVATR